MEQTIYDLIEGDTRIERLPDHSEEVMPGIFWGFAHSPFTPAFWYAQTWYANNRSELAYTDYRRGRCLRSEVVFCLLGGHGITAEMNEAAFNRLDSGGVLNAGTPDYATVYEALACPLTVGGRTRRYRFPKQKASFVHRAMCRLDQEDPPESGCDMRRWLLTFSGIGPKTASWITRNCLHSNQVAIIDIHVFRAGVIAGLFSGREAIAREYFRLEERFLLFANALGIEPRRLDVLIWRSMKDAGTYGLECFERHTPEQKKRC